MAKKRTQAQTPAPKKDRIEGSKANPKGSASGARGGIEISAQGSRSRRRRLPLPCPPAGEGGRPPWRDDSERR